MRTRSPWQGSERGGGGRIPCPVASSLGKGQISFMEGVGTRGRGSAELLWEMQEDVQSIAAI